MRHDSLVRTLPCYELETEARVLGVWPVAGIDEAGRGPLAGPVVAAAVILDPDRIPDGIADSKMLTPERRAALYDEIRATATVATAVGDVALIDSINILQATLVTMARAVAALATVPRLALVDGNQLPKLDCPCRPVVGGDGSCLSIAAASIVAKVTRDRIMERLAEEYPQFGFQNHKGYSTPEHFAALREHGPTPHHRRSFAPVRLALEGRADMVSEVLISN